MAGEVRAACLQAGRFFAFLFFIKDGNARVHMQVRGIILSADGGDRWRGSGKGGRGVGAQV